MDFCDGQFDCRITSDKVSADYHEVTNLVSVDWTKKRRGFMAESFIKPPVLITLTFPINIEVYRIIINPKVGRQISSGFEIFTCSKKVHKCWLKDENMTTAHGGSDEPSNMLFQQVGKAVLQESGTLCFRNVQYRPFGEWKPETTVQDDFPNVRDIRHHRLSSLSFVSHISVRVSRTTGGSAVGIQRLEVWGQPSRSCSTDVVEIIKGKFLSSLPNNIPPTTTQVNTRVHEKVGDQTNVDVYREKGIEVPEDFIDRITWHIMTVPMLLPSGENIDQSTLEKHSDNEASWGRPPSDPFTGIHFHGNAQAIPNASLKARIDKFILMHSDSLGHLPRTLGTGSDPSNIPSVSKLVSQYEKPSSVKRNYNNPVKNKRPRSDMDSSDMASNSKRKKEETPAYCETLKRKSEIPSKLCVTTDVRSPQFCRLENDESDVKPISHQDKLKSSLDSALASMLGSLPSFTKFSSTKANNSSSVCSVNKNTDGASAMLCCRCNSTEVEVMYRGRCSHLLCRDCLTLISTGTLVCPTCRTVWDRGEITRVHKQGK